MFIKREFFAYSVFCLALLLGSVLQAQDAYYQDKSGPVPLWYAQDKIIAKLTDGLAPQWGAILGSDPAFDPSQTPEPVMYGFYYIWLLPGSSVAGTLERLDTNQYIDLANPVYLQAGDSVGLVSFDRVSVKFLDSVAKSTIDSLNGFWQVTITDSIAGITNYYVLKVTKATGKSVLEIANIYEQDTRTEFAVPDFLANIST